MHVATITEFDSLELSAWPLLGTAHDIDGLAVIQWEMAGPHERTIEPGASWLGSLLDALDGAATLVLHLAELPRNRITEHRGLAATRLPTLGLPRPSLVLDLGDRAEIRWAVAIPIRSQDTLGILPMLNGPALLVVATAPGLPSNDVLEAWLRASRPEADGAKPDLVGLLEQTVDPHTIVVRVGADSEGQVIQLYGRAGSDVFAMAKRTP